MTRIAPALNARWHGYALAACAALLGWAVIISAWAGAWPVVTVAFALPVCVAGAYVSRRDAVAVLGLFVAVVIFIPARFAFTSLASEVTPALIVGLGAIWMWAFFKIVPSLGLAAGRQPVRWVLFVWLLAGGASLAAAFARPISEVEVRAAYLGILIMASCAGVALLAADGILSRERLDWLLKLLVIGASLAGVMGIVQFKTGFDAAAYLRPPGLGVTSAGESFIGVREGFRRVQGPTGHAIEFSMLVTMVLPLALHYARAARRQYLDWWIWWACVAVLVVGVPIGVSRSGVVGLALGLLILVPTWPFRQQVTVLALLAVGIAALKVAVPGLVGALIALFTYIGSDPSTVHRTTDYASAGPYIAASPLFGRGFHTWIPSVYFVIDNQYLSTILDSGFVGLAALLAVFAVGAGAAVSARQLSPDAAGRDLAQSLLASILVAAALFAFYDAFGFSVARGLTFLLVGCAGALWRIHRDDSNRILRPLPRADGRELGAAAPPAN